jgi:mono/diheme cytochrome c family protein
MLRSGNPAGALALVALMFIGVAVLHSSGPSQVRAGGGAVSSLSLELRATRSSPLDLEVAGELASLPAGTTRYLTREHLLELPQVLYTVSDDANFPSPTEISGVPLKELGMRLASAPESDLIVAVCDDQYRAFYPRTYLAAHHPVLALKINGQSPDRWPKDAEGHGFDSGPYLISHPSFTPSFRILAQAEEAQIPWGVIRIEFRDEKTVFGSIAPRGPKAADPAVQAGYRIAQQNCLRCHNMGTEGGQKAERSWLVLAAWASASQERFAAYVRSPKSKNPKAQMPGNPAYDDATIVALRAYFQTFTQPSATSPASRRTP